MRFPISTLHSSAILAVVGLCFAGCNKSTPEDNQLFEDVTVKAGVDFKHIPGEHEQEFFMPRCVGSGAAFIDFDSDGWLDIYCIQNGGPDSGLTNKIYRQVDGKFTDVSSGSGIDVDGFAMGTAVGDVNNDGKPDLVVSEYGRARLFINETTAAQPKFRDVSQAAGVRNELWGTSTCFVDYDRDGWLDIVLVNYVNYDPTRWCAGRGGTQDYCGPDAFPGRATRLLHNQGDIDGDGIGDAKFEDVTVSSGFADHPAPGLGVFCADFDGDRWPDIFIANDGKPNHLWINQKDGTFKEEAITRGLGYNSMGDSEADMGIAIGDVNSDGMFDIFVTHLTTETHTLWSQGPRGIFIDKTATSGIAATAWRGTGFGTVMADLDNDGDMDLALANGRVTRTPGEPPKVAEGLDAFWKNYAERDQIILNDGKGMFIDASEQNLAVSQLAGVSRGMACADFNNDGALDLLITRVSGPPALLKNTKANSANWLQVRAVDPKLNRDAYGAEVYVRTGSRTLMRWVNPGYSYLCSNDPRAHFGLGADTEIAEIKIVWPDGSVEAFPGGKPNQQITVMKGEGTPITVDQLSQSDVEIR